MKNFKQYVEGNLEKSLKDCTKEEVYLALLQFTKEKSAALPQNNGALLTGVIYAVIKPKVAE